MTKPNQPPNVEKQSDFADFSFQRFRNLMKKLVQIWSQRVEIAGKRREERENYTQPNAVSPLLTHQQQVGACKGITIIKVRFLQMKVTAILINIRVIQ